jgi:hypothetical protein
VKKCECCNVELLHYNLIGTFCPNCFSVFTTCLPSDEELAAYYYRFNESYHGGGRNNGAHKRQQKYAEKYLGLIQHFSSGSTLLDIGSSTNPFPNIASDAGYNVTVIDFIKPKNLNNSVSFVKSTIERYNTSSKFDIISAFAILEHTKYPFVSLKKMVDLCRPGGTIIIYLPEIGRYNDIYALWTSGWYNPPEHLNLLSRQCIIKSMSKLGCAIIYNRRFEIDIIRYLIRYGYGYFEATIGWIVYNLNPRLWLKIRRNRISKNIGMDIFVFRKR